MSSKVDSLIVEKNPLVAKQFARYFRSAGFRPLVVEDMADHLSQLDNYELFAADVYDSEIIENVLQNSSQIKILLWTAEPLERALRLVCDKPRLSNVLGRPNFESIPRDWELIMVLRRFKEPTLAGPKLAWFMNWGFTGFQETIDTSSTRDQVVHKVDKFVRSMGVRAKVAESFSEVAHELLMNAMYDAPIDQNGRPKYALDRKSDIVLSGNERPHFKLASDGSHLAIQVSDPFGNLKRNRVFDGIERGLTSGEMDTSHGGAGLGLTVIHQGTNALFFDVEKGKKTEVIGVFDLTTNHRDFRLMPKSLHYFSD